MNNEKTKKKEKTSFRLTYKTLIVIWLGMLALCALLYVVAENMNAPIISGPTWNIINLTIAFSTVVTSTLFSMVLIYDSNNNRKNNDDVNARSESFRTLQFIASNYACIDFVDYMLIYEVYKPYVKELKNTRDFRLYLREEDIDLDDVIDNTENYNLLTIRIPIQPLDGKSITAITYLDFNFHKEDGNYSFVPCTPSRNALIIYNKDDQRQEVVVNLIVKKTSEFYNPDTVNPFLKIKFNHTMYSLLGVAVSGSTELYFTNPHKLEKSGANKYTIYSSQFKISGLPKLLDSVDNDISQQLS